MTHGGYPQGFIFAVKGEGSPAFDSMPICQATEEDAKEVLSRTYKPENGFVLTFKRIVRFNSPKKVFDFYFTSLNVRLY